MRRVVTNRNYRLLLGVVALVVAMAFGQRTYGASPLDADSVANHIIISKQRMALEVYNAESELLRNYPVAVGKNYGNKRLKGDMKTPEGEFVVKQIQPSSSWLYDYGDGRGYVEGFYGDWFLRLDVPEFSGIGIHGTEDEASLGRRVTEGSIRLANEDIRELVSMIKVGISVAIEGSSKDHEADGIVDMQSSRPTAVITDDPVLPAEDQKETATPSADETAQKSQVTVSEGDYDWYTIQDGDLLGRVAQRFGTTLSEIKRLNPDINVDRISINQRIRIPRKGAVVEQKSVEVKPIIENEGEVWYTIQEGDLVGRIAQRYGTTSKRIAELNPDINIDRISIGQRIRVK